MVFLVLMVKQGTLEIMEIMDNQGSHMVKVGLRVEMEVTVVQEKLERMAVMPLQAAMYQLAWKVMLVS